MKNKSVMTSFQSIQYLSVCLSVCLLIFAQDEKWSSYSIYVFHIISTRVEKKQVVFEKINPLIATLSLFNSTHLKLYLATATHSFKWVK